ncbi:uncharacterized protein LOC124312029 isoform X1 [Daphnia pulicaria]|uniref:uncharacterized protein LOC124312029 isoform X1 n=2 Tax=Daphnia pulicaria TaxID=35523 RepID=UPI001EEB8AF8|nr:uncharacterized protein LOC124312029 isoform X1 [Daphnia pulicaria]
MMLNKMILSINYLSTFMLVILILSSSVASHPAISETPSDKTENNNSDKETSPEAHVSNRAYTSSTNSNNSVNSWRNLLPSHFGEFFEVFVFFMELKWHYEIEDAIAAVGHRINSDHYPKEIDATKSISVEAEDVDDKVFEHFLDRTKYLKYYLNAMAPVYYGYRRKSEN